MLEYKVQLEQPASKTTGHVAPTGEGLISLVALLGAGHATCKEYEACLRKAKADAVKDKPPEQRMQGMLRCIRNLDTKAAKAAKREAAILEQIELLKEVQHTEVRGRISDLEVKRAESEIEKEHCGHHGRQWRGR